MRQVVLDTETTGLETAKGHRIIEIGCVELLNRRLSGRKYHQYLNPQRDIDEGAQRVHGISREELEDKPLFADVAEKFLEFIRDSELIIHNAEFDIGFLEHELKLLSHPRPRVSEHAQVLDTLSMARRLHPGQRNSLDALCKRYEVDNSGRDLHGALLDADLLAGVYLAMTGGQATLSLDRQTTESAAIADQPAGRIDRSDLQFTVINADASEQAAHEALLDSMEESGRCLWRDHDIEP